MRRTPFTDLVGCKLPLQLAGMGGGLSDVALASVVTNTGGLGMIGAAALSSADLASTLEALSDATKGPYGVNFLMPFIERDAVKTAASMSRVCDFHFGTPDVSYIELAHDGDALAGWQIGSQEEAAQAIEAGCDFIIAQGFEAGGHVRGSLGLDELLADLIGRVEVPIVAAGGIGTAQRVRDVMDAGAAAVRIGTRFLAASESAAHPEYVAALIAASSEDTEVSETFNADWPDAPHRALTSSIRAVRETEGDVIATMGIGDEAWDVPRFSSVPPTKQARGNIAAMAQYAGTSVGSITKRQPAEEIVNELCALL